METIGEIFCSSPHQLYHHHHHQQQQQSTIAGENSFFYQFQEIPEENWYGRTYEEESSSMDDEDDVLERLLKEVDAKGHEMMKKLISKVEEELRDRRHHLRASRKLIARNMGRERGIDMEEELKNERFKMKTVNTIGSGVVKEEDTKQNVSEIEKLNLWM